MPTLTIEYKRLDGQSVADAMEEIRKVIASKQSPSVVLSEDLSWKEDSRWVIATVPYRFTASDRPPLLDPITIYPTVIKNSVDEDEEAEPEEKPVPTFMQAPLSTIFHSLKK